MTARIRRNTAAALAQYQVAGLAFLEDAVAFTVRILAVTYPAIFRVPRPSDHAELASARQLLDDCGHLLIALDAHRKQAAAQRAEGHPAKTKHDDDDDLF
jgi:hypothetical protein